MLRPTARLLTIVMLAASGRLLACGLECLDGLAASAQASCHQDSRNDSGLPTVALAKVGDTMHACLPDVTEPRVTVAKPASAQLLVTMPLLTPVVLNGGAVQAPRRHVATVHTQFESPHSPAPAILRI